MGCRGTTDYSFQAWVVALTSLFSGLVGFAQIVFGIWLVFFSRSIAPLLGIANIDVYYGYVGIGAFTCLTALLGCTASLVRRVNCLIVYVTILFASIAFQCTIGAYIYVEQEKISEDLVVRILDNPEISETIDFHFNCRLQMNDTMTAVPEAEICSEFVDRQLWNLVWGELGLCGAIVCIQFVIFTMSIMMSRLVNRARACTIHPAPIRINVRPRGRDNHMDNLEAETPTSTAPFFSTTPSITPNVPSSASSTSAPVHFNLAVTNPLPSSHSQQHPGRRTRSRSMTTDQLTSL